METIKIKVIMVVTLAAVILAAVVAVVVVVMVCTTSTPINVQLMTLGDYHLLLYPVLSYHPLSTPL